MAHRVPAAALALIAAALAGCASLGTGAWEPAPPMREARAAHAVAASPDAVYAVAGTGDGGRPVRRLERFDGRQWHDEGELPGEGLNAPSAAVLGSRLYVIGGFGTTTNVPVARVHVYDLATRRWHEAAPLPRPRGGHAAAVLGGRLHVIGGGNSESTLADHAAYDPVADRWTELAPLPRAMGSPAAVVHDGTLWSIGGRSGPSDFADVWRYDAAADRWHPAPPLPSPRGTAGAVSHCGTIWLVGGESQAARRTLDEAWRFDGRTWTPAPPLPTARSFARSVVLDGSVLVVGGSVAAGNSHAAQGSAAVERWRGCR